MICEIIFQRRDHVWYAFAGDPGRDDGQPESNQLAVATDRSAALIDPAGLASFPAFLAAFTERLAVDDVEHLLVSNDGWDLVSSLPLWRRLLKDSAKVYVPALAADAFAPVGGKAGLVAVPDEGMRVSLVGGVDLDFVPAHYLPQPAQFSVYDAKARVLFSGAVGAALLPRGASQGLFVEDFASYAPHLEAFHARWMPSAAARDAWVRQVSRLDVDVLVPRHGLLMRGGDVRRFLEWFHKFAVGGGVSAMAGPKAAARPAPSAPAAAPIRPQPPPKAAVAQARAPRIKLSVKPARPVAIAAEPVRPPPAPSPKPVPAEPLAVKPPAAEPPAAERVPFSAAALLDGLEEGRKYRLITRSDFDGLACAVLLEELNLIDDILFVHPKDMQDGNIPVSASDISTNLPYVPGIGVAFDHHLSETIRLGGRRPANHVIDASAPSAARVVYNHFGGEAAFPNVSKEMMEAVDKADSAHFSEDEVLEPKGWVLLNFLMDSRTGLGRFRGFRIPNYELMMSLIEACRTHPIEEILELPDVKERVDLYMEHHDAFVDQIHRSSEVFGNLVVLDLRQEETIHPGNRFVIYALHPQCNISMHVMWGMQKQNTVFAVGKSIFDRTSKTNVGQLMLEYGGGGHAAAGTCQVDNDQAQQVKQELIERIIADG